jgi:hypothetical protein
MMTTHVILREISLIMNNGCATLRASKVPYKDFEYNTRRAEALARLDGYLEDLLHNEGKGTFEPLFRIPNELMQALGFGQVIDKTLKRIGEEMKKEFEAEYEQKGKEYYEAVARDYFKRLKPRLQKIVKMFEDLGLIMDQTLLEQALVVAVSAFEVYLQELATSIIMLNPSIRKRFYPEIDRAMKLAKLEEYGLDARRTQGEIVADLIKLDANSIKSVFSRLLDLQNVFNDKKTESKVCKIFETRNVIVHRAGLTDPKFKKATKSKGAIDTQIKLSRRFVLNSIKILKDIAQRIEKHINQPSSAHTS